MIWMFRRFATGLLAVFLFGVPCGIAIAQQEPTQPQDVLRAEVNQGTVGIISGGVNGTYIRIASDLASVLDNGNKLRILPIVGKGSVQNITDILYLRGIDIGIVQSDVLTFIARQGIHPTIEKRIRYITKLYNEEFHLLTGEGIKTIQDLAGKKVNFGIAGSGTYMTASTVFKDLDVEVEPVSYDQALALEKLKSGEIAGMVYVAGKPTALFRNLEGTDGVHLVDVPATPKLLETYLPSLFSHEDYPLLVPEGEPVETVAVGAVMAVYNWDPKTDRYRKVENFVKAFFDNFDEFLKTPRHQKWQEVNLAAVVPGWIRFKPAEQWLDTRSTSAGPGYNLEQRQMFEAFLKFMQEKGEVGKTISDKERAGLFNQFLRWQQGEQ
jgi:TRAP transporter TAXI family solute receptor